MVAAVLTTISHIDGRADEECFSANAQFTRDSTAQDCKVLEVLSVSTGSAASLSRSFSRWCCGMVRDGDFLSRPAIQASASMACAAALWGCFASALTGNAAITFAGSGYLAAGSAFLLGWGSRGDQDGEWLLCGIVWLATLTTPVSLLACPLPFLYDGVAVTGGMLSSTSRVRRAIACTAALAEAALLPAVPGGAIVAMCVALAARFALALAAATAPTVLAPRARARAERAAQSPALRAAEAAAAARRGLVSRAGRIAAAHVFEFDPAGPRAEWQWIFKDGERRGLFSARPFDEYRRPGDTAADSEQRDGAGPPRRRCCGCGACPGWGCWA